MWWPGRLCDPEPIAAAGLGFVQGSVRLGDELAPGELVPLSR